MIRLRVPGSLTYRTLALRVVTAACDMARSQDADADSDEFDAQTVTAVGEAFNNIAIHSYSVCPGDVDIEIEFEIHQISIRMMDTGASFDPSSVPEPELNELPESGMGLFIMNSFMDEVTYTAGKPNVLCMVKRRSSGSPQPRDITPAPSSSPPDSDGSGGQSGWRMMGLSTANPTSSSNRSGV